MLDSNKINDKDAPEPKPHLHKSVSSIFGQGAIGEQKQPEPALAAAVAVPAAQGLKFGGDLIWKIGLGVSLAVVLFFYFKMTKEASLRTKLERELAQVGVARTKVAERMAYTLKTLKDSVNEIDQLKSEFEQWKQTVAEMNKKHETAMRERFDFEAAIKSKDQKIAELKSQMEALEETKAQLQTRNVASASGATPLEPKTAAASPTASEGKILIVKPANAMAVVSLGSRDGIRQGSIFEIYTPNNDYVAKLIIDDVEETIAIGKISPESASGRVKENYTAELK